MTMSVTRPRPVVPEELPKLLHSISYAVIKNNPNDIISFAANHFQQLYDEREQQKKVAEDMQNLNLFATNLIICTALKKVTNLKKKWNKIMITGKVMCVMNKKTIWHYK
ncbi:uncharacterized protein LOC118196846 isoform X2 [Stegodyphus dumicola]|uniref:uncharacterized protein LOC118196846 isoform X2 n=1 Tax=Stegodyphus dumicola TaxID=202533 RepID=UPI0015A89453|nr:uncharacterized protein LOC118196846 isoform X2 [Stegodyphus dumicola]